ncbi:MAG: crossover junction endodeoxyribonuclease RuvC [Candidatus Omnitrophota bacterium]|nr:crossover junction endodeoxyribonuclease RuvC [Candidatus Omnitrophota bacterium]
MRILGVDPGSWRTGVGVIEIHAGQYQLVHVEVVKIAQGLAIPKRLERIHEGLGEVIRRFSPDIMALESVFFGKDIRALVRIGEARAAAMLAASEQDVPVVEYAPAKVKQSISGSGRASKEQMQYMVKSLLKLQSAPPSDGADALAVAICHAHSNRAKQSITEAQKKLQAILGKKRKRKKDVSLSYRKSG